MTVFAHETTLLQVGQVREICNTIAAKQIDKGTFSRWCSRFEVSGEAAAEIPLSIAASLVTFAMLHAVDARRLDGDGYKRLYPAIYRRMIELYGRRNNYPEQWRSANPATEEAGPHQGQSASASEPCESAIAG